MKSILDKLLFHGLLDEGETIIYVAHVHPFLVYPVLCKAFFLGILMPILGYWLFPMMPEVWVTWAIIGAMISFYRVTQWYMDAWVITDMAVINQEWNSPFHQSTNRIEYGNIEAITNEIKGFWATIFRFGNIQIDYVSSNPIVLTNVARPKKVERLIMENQTRFVTSQTYDDHSKLKELLTSLLRSNSKKG